MIKQFLYPIYFITIVFLGSCTEQIQKTATPVKRNVALLYNPSSTPLHPEFTLFHERQDYSRLYVKLFTQELLFNQANREGVLRASIELHYELREIENGLESKGIADSSTLSYKLNRSEVKDIFITSVPVKADYGKMYSMKVTTTDKLRNKSSIYYIDVDKSSVNTPQHFKVIIARTGYPSFDNVFTGDEIFYVQCALKNIDTLYIKYYQNKFPLPRPPVTNLSSPKPEFIPDSIYAYPYSDTTKYLLPRPGMYHIQIDLVQPGGLSLYNFRNSYPRVTEIEDMISPLAYLTSSVEFNDIMNQVNQKLALDNFWLQAAGNAQSARELIRIYYNRVFLANYYFTSYKEGWKTDRGMIFIIYGPPNTLSKSAFTEVWTYYRKKGREPLRFTFSKNRINYSDNDYLLERDFVNSMWMQAVQDWRKGKVFYPDNS